MVTSVPCRLHGSLSQPRGELRNPGDLALLTYSLNRLYTKLEVYNENLDTEGEPIYMYKLIN